MRPIAADTEYTITEDVGNLPTPPTDESGYVLTSLECSRNGGAPDPGTLVNGELKILLSPGDTGVCTYTNKLLPKLTIVKNAVNPALPADPTEFTFTPADAIGTIPFDLGNNDEETFTDIPQGAALSVTEGAVAEWTLTSLECTGVGADSLTIDTVNAQVSGRWPLAMTWSAPT